VRGLLRKPYRHHDEGFLVDLGGAAAAANPLVISAESVPLDVDKPRA
jgi:NADH:ubiquinone reductase (H+-translocating)